MGIVEHMVEYMEGDIDYYHRHTQFRGGEMSHDIGYATETRSPV